jgi:hypothetical protein
VIARSHWRRGSDGQEIVPAAGEVLTLFDSVKKHESWGKITSRPAYTQRELEWLAYKLGSTVAAVKQAIAQGLLP